MNITRQSLRSGLMTVLLVTCGAAGMSAALPQEYFRFSHDNAHGGFSEQRFSESSRMAILSALRSGNRDAGLKAIAEVHFVSLNGEDWFDLRGLPVYPGEIPPSVSLVRLCLDGAYFEGIDLSGADLSGALLRGSHMGDTTLTKSTLDGAYLDCAEFTDVDARGASLRGSHFGLDSVFKSCNLDDAVITNAVGVIRMVGGSAVKARFTGARLAGSEFTHAVLDHADYTEANLKRCDFFASSLRGTDFSDASLEGAKLNQAIVGADSKFIRASLAGAYLGDMRLSGADVAYLRWPNADYSIGEELDGDQLATDDDSSNLWKAREYARAEVAYRALADRYRQLGYLTEYQELKYRALEARRKYLAVSHGSVAERVWLTTYRMWSGYGTSFAALFRTGCLILMAFACVFLTAWFRRVEWFEWRNVDFDQAASSVVNLEVEPPHEWFRSARSRAKRASAIASLVGEALLCSAESLLIFGEPLLRLQRILRLARQRNVALVAVKGGRRIVAAEALIGIILASSFATQLVNTLTV